MKLLIPSQFQKLIGEKELLYESATVGALLKDLTNQYPDLTPRLFNKAGGINNFINVYVNDEDIRFLDGLKTKLKETDTVLLIPSIAGG